MIFRIFSISAEYISSINNEVNEFIGLGEDDGLKVVDKSVHVVNYGDNNNIKPTVVISIWMDKQTKSTNLLT